MRRIYAITSKNRIITSCFGAITISQFSLGLYVVADAAGRGCESDKVRPRFSAYLTVSASPVPRIPLPSYTICLFVRQLSGEIAFIAMSLVYGMEFLLSLIDYPGGTRSDLTQTF